MGDAAVRVGHDGIAQGAGDEGQASDSAGRVGAEDDGPQARRHRSSKRRRGNEESWREYSAWQRRRCSSLIIWSRRGRPRRRMRREGQLEREHEAALEVVCSFM